MHPIGWRAGANQRSVVRGGTQSSNPVPSSGESANHRFLSGEARFQDTSRRRVSPQLPGASMTRRMSDEDRVKLITARRVAEAVTLVVNELPQGEGAPAHALYAGIVAFLSIDEFETMMRGLVFAGRVRREGDLYYPVGEA